MCVLYIFMYRYIYFFQNRSELFSFVVYQRNNLSIDGIRYYCCKIEVMKYASIAARLNCSDEIRYY